MKLKGLNLLTNLKLNPTDGLPTELFAFTGQQDINDGHSYKIFDDLKTPAVSTLDS